MKIKRTLLPVALLLSIFLFMTCGCLPVRAAVLPVSGKIGQDVRENVALLESGREAEAETDSPVSQGNGAATDNPSGQKEGEATSNSSGQESEETAESQLDIDALEREMESLEEEYEYPDFSAIFDALLDFRFVDALEEAGVWLVETLTYEISTSWVLMGELVGVILFAAIFNNTSSSFRQFAIGDSGFLISYFITFTIIFANFTIMANLFEHTVETLSKLLKMVIPVYTLAVTLSGNLSVGVVFYEYFMIVVLVVNWICLTVILPMIQYYLLLELLNNFSARQNISRLCESLYLLLSKSMKFLFVLFFGFHLLETMVVPSFDATKNAVFNRIVGMIPGAGSVVQSVAGTVVGSSIMIKNTMGATAIIFILLLLAIPIIKLLLYCLFYLILSILLEPVADERFIRCISAAQKSGILLVYTLGITAALFILTIAVTSLATNKV